MTDSGWLHYRDLKSRCPVCKRPAHIAKRTGNFYFVDDEYNPFVRHALATLAVQRWLEQWLVAE